MIGTRVEVAYLGDRPAEVVEVSHYALGRLARWARLNGVPTLSPDMADTMADKVLCLQLVCWAECTRGQAKPVDFDEWCATVDDFNQVEVAATDPTPPAT